MCCQHFADQTVFGLKLSSGQRETVTALHILDRNVLIWSRKTDKRAVAFSQKHSMLSRASGSFSLSGEKENWKLRRRGVCRGDPNQALSSCVLEGMGRGHRNGSLSTPPSHSSNTLTISQNRNELSVKGFRVNNFFSQQCMKIEYRNLLKRFLGYWGFSGSGELRGGGIQL